MLSNTGRRRIFRRGLFFRPDISFRRGLFFGWSLFFCLTCQVANAQFRVVGYLTTWDHFPAKASHIQFTKITHLNIACAEPDAEGNLTVFGGLSGIVDKAHAQRVKVLISLGGAELNGTRKNWKKFTSPAYVNLFCNKIAGYLIKNNLDGIDIDLEGDIIGSQYENFIKILSATLKPKGKLVTAAVATWFEEQIPAACFAYFDFVNIMSFDLTGPGNAAHPGPHAPYSQAVKDIRFWKNKGLPREKMGLGLPFYGYGFYANTAVDEIAYKDILKRYPGAEQKDKAGHIIYYNGLPTIKEKTKLALREAGGIMIWQLNADAEGDKSLLNALDSVIMDSRR
jgi:chitinase